MSCPVDTNPLYSVLTHSPGWSAHKRLVVLDAAPAALTVPAGRVCALSGSSGSIAHVHHSLSMAESSSRPDRVTEPRLSLTSMELYWIF